MSNPHHRMVWWLPSAVCLLLLSACEPRTIQIQGLEELTSEIRSQRLSQQSLLKQSLGAPAANQVDVRGAQIQEAMAPLREVLTQLGNSQRDLSTRQATLTQEMRRWTQLLVQTLHNERNEEAVKMAERLAELEQTIAQQDVRHRQVEELLGSALDRTADQLEDFLKRLGASTGQPVTGNNAEGGAAPGASIPNAPENEAPTNEPSSAGGTPEPELHSNGASGDTTAPASGNGQPTTNAAEGKPKPRADGTAPGPASSPTSGGMSSKRGSMAWLWGLAVVSLVSGLALLIGRRRMRTVRMAPEMQFRPQYEGAVDDYKEVGLAHDASTQRETPAAAPATDKPEVEGLWAAAALLGEAIDRLKLTGEAMPPELGGAQALPEAPAYAESEALSELGYDEDGDTALDDIFIIDEDDELLDADFADDDFDGHAVVVDGGGPEYHEHDAPCDVGSADPKVIVPMPAEAVRDALASVIPVASVGVDAAVVLQRPVLPTTSSTTSSPTTYRLHLPAKQDAEGKLRSLLGSDPRVLVTPAPQVRNAMGELEVSFALLPGLGAGERSLLEQQLRDTVA